MILFSDRWLLAIAAAALVVLIGVILMLLRNIRRQSLSEAERERQRAILRTMLDVIRDGVAMFSADGELLVFNENFFKFLAIPSGLMRAGASLEAFQAIDRARGRSIFKAATAPPSEGPHEFRHVNVEGRELDIYRALVPTGGFVKVCIDVTERMKSEAAARQSQKMEAIGHLTGGAAHDFNNLLQVIGANLERLLRDTPGESQSAARVRNSMEAVAHGAKLVAQLLAFARRQPLNPRSTNIGRVVQDMAELLRRTLGEAIEVECVIGGGLWNALVDPGQTESAILNLAVNARDAMPGGGKLTIEVANAFLDEAYADQHPEVVAGQYVMIAVTDTGCGMSAETLARAFEPFFTTKPEGGGTGLGLSQVYGFAKQSGGHVKIYSELGQGTTVKLYLPRSRRAQDAHSPGPPAIVEGRGECVLVVEDEEIVRSAAVETISDLGYSVLQASDASRALAILRETSVDVLFTDVVMPGPTNARELVRLARQLQPGIVVLYTSGYTRNAIVHNGKLDDDVFLLSKPYCREQLAQRLHGLLEARGAGRRARVSSETSNRIPPGKVLVVEDAALIRMTTAEMIREAGLPALEAANGEEALAALRQNPDISVLLTDLGLPDMDGRRLIAEASKLRPHLKVIVATGYVGDLGVDEFAAPVVHLAKPFDIDQLRKALAI
ncbi:MAG TPA: response regulator [Rhizomicrobium sp.]|nr:response regulator [Rhizomicrobium sp.]